MNARVLVVDDDPLIRLLAREALLELGLEVDEAEDGPAALAAAEAVQPDLILLDVVMPGMSGFEVCRHLRDGVRTRLIPVIMLTGLGDEDSIARAFDAGATDFILKPINWTLLRFRTRYVLRTAQLMKELVRNKESLSNAQRIARLGSWEWYPDEGRLVRSVQYYRLFGQTPETLQGDMEAVLPLVYGPDRAAVAAAFGAARQGMGYQLTYRVVWPDGSVRTVQETAEPILPEMRTGPGEVIEGSIQDITDQVDAQRRIRQLAYFDPLTGLPNREFFREALLAAVARLQRQNGRCAVMVLDIDRFARINESLGEDRGDQVLQVLAHRLREAMGDRLQAEPAGGGNLPRFKVARLAADEFGILLPDVVSDDEALDRAQALLGVLRAPIRVPGQDIVLSARIGVALLPEHALDADALLKAAETALSQAKRGGGGHISLFSEQMKVAAFLRFTLEGDLSRAIHDEVLQVVYQPIIDVDSGKIVKAEALVRWPHLARGSVPPSEFISLAEESGLIVPLTRAVMGRVVADVARLALDMPAGFRVAVNLSGLNFMDARLIPGLRAQLEAAGVHPSRLEFELTETVLMRDLDYATQVLGQLRDMGFKVAVDDFGTGYSSLAYLRKLAVDTLKIDRSFVNELNDGQGMAIVEAVIGLAHSLGLEVVAEGVETVDQLEALRQRGCHLVQGYLFATPMPWDKLAHLLQGGPLLPGAQT
jgi:diguanylate cyclase (GGDEF)-like protein